MTCVCMHVGGGNLLPISEKRRMGLEMEQPSGCPADADRKTTNSSGNAFDFEDLSGWSIAKTVQVLTFDSDSRGWSRDECQTDTFACT